MSLFVCVLVYLPLGANGLSVVLFFLFFSCVKTSDRQRKQIGCQHGIIYFSNDKKLTWEIRGDLSKMEKFENKMTCVRKCSQSVN